MNFPARYSDAELDPGDYSIIVKRRSGVSLNRWRWEIHRAGRSSPVRASKYLFETIAAAKHAGDAAYRVQTQSTIN